MPTYMTPEDAEDGLTRLLLRAAPPNEHGHKTIEHLAKWVPISRHSIHKWIRKQKIPPSRVLRIVEVSKVGEPGYHDSERDERVPRVKREDFDPFVYKV